MGEEKEVDGLVVYRLEIKASVERREAKLFPWEILASAANYLASLGCEVEQIAIQGPRISEEEGEAS